MEENKEDKNFLENKSLPENLELLSISDCYLIDLECIREMFISISPILKKQEKERKKLVDKQLNKLSKKTEGSEIKVELLSSEIEYLVANIRKMNRAEKLFKQQLTVSLISLFDEFLSSLLKIILRLHPEWLNSSEKTLTYKDLVNLGSIHKAITGLLDKEVDELMRKSHEEQIQFVDKKLKLGIQNSFSRLHDFLELTERRNLFVHTGGKVTKQYLEKCKTWNINVNEEINNNSILNINTEYFNNAFSLCFEIGLRIANAAYRRIFPLKLEAVDKSINNLAIKFLNSGDYDLAEIVCEFYLGIPEKLRSTDNELIYFVKINRALAQKFNKKEFRNGLLKENWNAFHPKYQLALAVLNDKFEEAGNLMKKEAIQDSIGKLGFRIWPLFKDFRATEIFQKVYKDLYNETFTPNPNEYLDNEAIAQGILLSEEKLTNHYT